MNAPLLTQWQRLIFPPAPIQAGEQLREGNEYPNVIGSPDWQAHQDGRRTYAVNPVYPGPDGESGLCQWAVLDIDEGADSLPKARALLALCEVAGLSARAAWSGGKGCHVWLFFEPAPAGLARAVLKRLKAAVPFTGELIPGDLVRAKVPPAFHQVKRFWAFFFETLPDTAPALEKPPTGFLEAQAAILAGVVPTAVPVLANYANAGGERREPEPEKDMVPDLGKLGGGDLAPCISALVERGAQTALGGWDKNALTLARYVKAAGIEPDAALALLKTVSDNTAPDFATTKDWNAKARHWASIKEPGAFGCGFILAARQALGFRCKGCPAAPIGITRKFKTKDAGTSNAPGNGKPGANNTAPLFLEPALADSLLQLALQSGLPEARISPAIFPPVALPDTGPDGKPIMAELHSLAWNGISAGATTPAALLNWVDRQPGEPPGPPVKVALAALVQRLLGLSPVPEPEAAALIIRASDLTARRDLLSALGTGTAATNDRKPLMDVIGGLHETTARLQQAAGTAWGAPLTAYRAELLDGLIQVDRPTVATPFPTLNDLLGGGLHGGKLYVLAAPPGGGKTTLATQIADHAAANRIPVCYVALEMGRGQLFDYALARHIGMNSSKVEARNYRHSEPDRERLAAAALDYLDTVAPWLSVIEGDWETTAGLLKAWVVQARARYGITATAPVLLCVDYLQLLNTGNEKLDGGGQENETAKVSQLAVQVKQLARDTGAAVLALSDITKTAQEMVLMGKEFNLGMLRGSNRLAHAADTVLALYSEAGKGEGGKADNDPWTMLAQKYQGSPTGRDFVRGLDDLRHAHPTGGPGASVRARLELLKNRGGRGRGSQVLLYERAYHRFKGLSVPGQDAAEGRGDPDSPAPSSNTSSYNTAQGGGSAKPGATGHHAPRSKPPVADLDRAWKAEKKRYMDSGEAQQHIDPATGAIDPDYTPDWLRMKNEAARQKEARRNGGGDY